MSCDTRLASLHLSLMCLRRCRQLWTARNFCTESGSFFRHNCSQWKILNICNASLTGTTSRIRISVATLASTATMHKCICARGLSGQRRTYAPDRLLSKATCCSATTDHQLRVFSFDTFSFDYTVNQSGTPRRDRFPRIICSATQSTLTATVAYYYAKSALRSPTAHRKAQYCSRWVRFGAIVPRDERSSQNTLLGFLVKEIFAGV